MRSIISAWAGAREQAVYVEQLRFMDDDIQEINHIPLDEAFRERFGNPYPWCTRRIF